MNRIHPAWILRESAGDSGAYKIVCCRFIRSHN